MRDSRLREQVRRLKTSYDVRYRVDGHGFRYSLDRKGWAEDFKQRLRAGFAAGWLFDPDARQFLDPDAEVVEGRQLTFFEHAREYLQRKWPSWEPATRRNAQRDLARACLELLRDDAPALTGRDRVAADAYLRRAPLMWSPDVPSDGDGRWEEWFLRWSRPLAKVTDQHLQEFVAAVRSTALDGTPRTLAPASVARIRAVVKGAFSSALKRRLIEWDPWLGVEADIRHDSDQVDPDLVMDPTEVRRMAAFCAEVDPRYDAFVRIQGFCGLRPGEAIDLRRRDLTFPRSRHAVVTVRGSHSTVPSRFLTDGETRRRPLKGRGEKAVRPVPLPSEVTQHVEGHLRRFVAAQPDALVFTAPAGGRINLSNFHRDVWKEAREQAFPAGSPLRKVRRHDLRHSAITAWLNAGVPLKTAQAWSGHRTVSVLLDTYLGVMRGDEELAIARYEAALRATEEDSRGPV